MNDIKVLRMMLMKSEFLDRHGLVVGSTVDEKMLFRRTRMNMLRDEVLPSLKSILKDHDDGGSFVLIYTNNMGVDKKVYPRWMMKMLYAQVTKLLDYLDEDMEVVNNGI